MPAVGQRLWLGQGDTAPVGHLGTEGAQGFALGDARRQRNEQIASEEGHAVGHGNGVNGGGLAFENGTEDAVVGSEENLATDPGGENTPLSEAGIYPNQMDRSCWIMGVDAPQEQGGLKDVEARKTVADIDHAGLRHVAKKFALEHGDESVVIKIRIKRQHRGQSGGGRHKIQ